MTETKPKKSVTKPASQRPPAALGKAKTADEITRRSFFLGCQLVGSHLLQRQVAFLQ